MNEGIALSFSCRTSSPFHTTRQQYSNLAKCAPFILGSTIRGAILARLIEREVCPHVDKALATRGIEPIGAAHRACADPHCPIKPFFAEADESPRAWFSFGLFDVPEPTRIYRAATRIALERDKGAVAEGAILTIESIAPETPFSFRVTLFGDAMRVADDVAWAVQATAETQGIGRFRSIGYGQFRVEKIERAEFAQQVAAARQAWENVPPSAEFVTPYIIGRGDGKVAGLDRAEFIATVRAQMSKTLGAVGLATAPALRDATLTLTPEYLSRFSYEAGAPQHRLVAWQGSGLALEWTANDADAPTALAIVSLLGLGEWSDCGFGQLRPTTRTRKRHGAYLPRR
ncbi:MAG: hypothetical protein FJ009_17275 [Chloroflexi bacterium]|nr:hypothetical protein [Chloroflexota bacterium]